jgi:hypothetical protein
MKKLAIIETKNYFGNTVYKYGYWKQGIIVQGWDSFGPVAEMCKNVEEAKNFIAEWTYEDSYAKLIAKPGKMFIEIDKESMFNKRSERQKLRLINKPECKGVYYSWDGTPIYKFEGTFEQFDTFYDIAPGERLVYFYQGDMYERLAEWDYKEQRMVYTDLINHKNIYEILSDNELQ